MGKGYPRIECGGAENPLQPVARERGPPQTRNHRRAATHDIPDQSGNAAVQPTRRASVLLLAAATDVSVEL